MTGYTVHTGSTEKFAEGWDVVFGKTAKAKKKAAKPAKAKASPKRKRRK